MAEQAGPSSGAGPTPLSPKVEFRNPNFKVHPSCLPFALPLSKLTKLRENQDRSLTIVAIVLNPVLVLDEGRLPQGTTQFGTDQTILESVARVVREQTGVQVSGVRALVGTYSPQPPTPPREGHSAEARTRCHAFLATASPADEASAEKGYSFRPMNRIDLDSLSTGDKNCLRAARKWMSRKADDRQTDPGSGSSTAPELVGIPPTRLVKPTFNVAADLKAYLLPLAVFGGLPINKGKLLSAGAVILHPEPDRKILLLQRARSGHWDLPSLRATAYEELSIVHVAVHSVRQATGLEVRGVRGLVGSFERAHAGSGLEEKRYLFLVKPVHQEGQLEVKLDEKWGAFKWVAKKEELDGLVIAPEVRVVVDNVLAALLSKASEASR